MRCPCLGLALTMTLAACGAPALRVLAGRDTLDVQQGDDPLVAYRHRGNDFKSYVAGLWTTGGSQVLRDAPPDHSHHHGLMFALGVADVDFWGEVHAEVPGVQRGRKTVAHVVTRPGDGTQAVLDQPVVWVDPRSDKVFLMEQRRIEIAERGAGEPTQLTWRSSLRVPAGAGAVELWGRHYFGLGMRFIAELDRVGEFLTFDDAPSRLVRGDEHLVRARWCAYVVRAGGREVTLAMFDHPDNPRHPATWFTMAKPFAYLAATLGLEEKRMQITSARPLRLCYGVALWDGVVDRQQIDGNYRSWLRRCAETERP